MSATITPGTEAQGTEIPGTGTQGTDDLRVRLALVERAAAAYASREEFQEIRDLIKALRALGSTPA
jgi:hypothetical protein